MELGGQPSFFHDGALVFPDDGHPVLLYDCEPLFLFDDEHRSILSDYKGLGVPSIALQIILSRATSVGLCRGSQVPHFVPSLPVPIPNATEKSRFFC